MFQNDRGVEGLIGRRNPMTIPSPRQSSALLFPRQLPARGASILKQITAIAAGGAVRRNTQELELSL